MAISLSSCRCSQQSLSNFKVIIHVFEALTRLGTSPCEMNLGPQNTICNHIHELQRTYGWQQRRQELFQVEHQLYFFHSLLVYNTYNSFFLSPFSSHEPIYSSFCLNCLLPHAATISEQMKYKISYARRSKSMQKVPTTQESSQANPNQLLLSWIKTL